MKWDVGDPAFTSSFQVANFIAQNLLNDSDASFTIHQMITDWDESSDFGYRLPVRCFDYVEHPVPYGISTTDFSP